MSYIKPCPKCGNDHLTVCIESILNTFYYRCDDCLYEGPGGDSPFEARELWDEHNTRIKGE